MRIYFFLLLVAVHLNLWGQEAKHVTLSGVVADSATGGLASSTVILLNPVDSVIASFAITDTDGNFTVKRVTPGDYILQVSFIGYQPHEQELKVAGDKTEVNLGVITLETANAALDEVLVKGERIPMMINKDTIIYSADAFKTRPNDVVEDLLKKLPGVEVESDGTIKAQGEEVQQVLVDGKEFFGKDPQIAVKNLPAAAVDKVEVFDKKSDAAEFTGIDDGLEEKAINLELKEDHKKGLFGSLSAGYGTDERFETKAVLNKFSKNQQISFLGMANNVNRQGFSMDEFIGFSGGLGNLMGRGGMVRIDGNNNAIPLSQGVSNGFVNTGAGGINFNHDFDKKTELNLSYFYSDIKNVKDRYLTQESVNANSEYFGEESEEQTANTDGHRLSGRLDYEIDSTQNIRLRSTLSFSGSEMNLLANSMILNQQGLLANTGSRDNVGEGDEMKFNTELIYRKKFGKKGRNMTAGFTLASNTTDQLIFLNSTTIFEESLNRAGFTELVMQDQTESNDANNYKINLSYTEPLGNNNFLYLGYTRQNFSNNVIKDVFDNDLDGERVFNDRLSNLYNRDYIYDRGETSWRWIKDNSNLQIGVNAQRSSLVGIFPESEDEDILKKYFNLLPKLSWNYDFASSKSLRLSYTTNVREPSLQQLQPIVDNSNPLMVYIGNPDLRPEYTHRLMMRYFSFSQFSMTNFFAMINANYTDNAIVNARTIDENFRQITTPINVENDYRISSFTGFGTPLRFLQSRFNLHGNLSYNKGRVFINNLEENTDRISPSIDVSFDNLKKDILDLRIGTKLGSSQTMYSISSDLDQRYTNTTYYSDINVSIGDSWNIGTSLDYKIYNTQDETQRIPLWNASVSKYLLKRRGELKLAAYDILDRNAGILQNIDLNYIETVQIESLAQYFMVSFTYAINQMIGQSNLPKGGMRMHRVRK